MSNINLKWSGSGTEHVLLSKTNKVCMSNIATHTDHIQIKFISVINQICSFSHSFIVTWLLIAYSFYIASQPV